MTVSFVTGASLVLGCSLGASLSLVSEKRKRIIHTEAILGLILHVRSNIDHFLTPIDGIFAEYRNETLESCGFSAVLRNSGIDGAVSSHTASLSDETEAVLAYFSRNLGGGYKDDQLNLCDYCCEKLEAELEREREELKRNISVYRFAPPIFALFIILCFL